MTSTATDVRIGISFYGRSGKTCDRCRFYRLRSEYRADAGQPGGMADICDHCARSAVESGLTWDASLWGLGDNDSAWVYWDKQVRDGEATLANLLARTQHAVILEEIRTEWSLMVRWSGMLNVQGGRQPTQRRWYLFDAKRPPAIDAKSALEAIDAKHA